MHTQMQQVVKGIKADYERYQKQIRKGCHKLAGWQHFMTVQGRKFGCIPHETERYHPTTAEACNNAEPSQTQQVVEVIKMRITKGTETKSAKNAGSSQDHGHPSQQQSKGDNLDTSRNHNLHKEV